MKAFTIYLAAFFIVTNAFAQVSIGLRGGFNAAYITDFPNEITGASVQKEFMHGNYSALYFEVPFSAAFAIQPELSYIQKGGRMNFGDPADVEFKVKLDYIELPLLAKVRFGNGPLSGYLAVGPSVGYALRGETQLEYDDENEDEDTYFFDNVFGSDARKDMRWDFSAVAGGGLQYQLGIGKLVLDGRLAIDLNDFNHFEGEKPERYESILSRNAMISIGYQLPLVVSK